MAADKVSTAKASEEEVVEETAEEPAKKGGKKPTVVTDVAGGIERYSCSAGDYSTFGDTTMVEAHIAEAH